MRARLCHAYSCHCSTSRVKRGFINLHSPWRNPPALSARLESGRLRGWAWAENLGWLNLDDPASYVGVQTNACYANCDASTIAPILNVNDFTCFLNRYA